MYLQRFFRILKFYIFPWIHPKVFPIDAFWKSSREFQKLPRISSELSLGFLQTILFSNFLPIFSKKCPRKVFMDFLRYSSLDAFGISYVDYFRKSFTDSFGMTPAAPSVNKNFFRKYYRGLLRKCFDYSFRTSFKVSCRYFFWYP